MAQLGVPRRAGEHAAHRDAATAAVGQVGHEVGAVAQCMPAAGRRAQRERRLAGGFRSGGRAKSICSPVPVCALTAGVAAIDARPPGPIRAVCGLVANRAEPLLDHRARPNDVENSCSAVWSRHGPKSDERVLHRAQAPGLRKWDGRFDHVSNRLAWAGASGRVVSDRLAPAVTRAGWEGHSGAGPSRRFET